jgi:hypothetical protein
MRTLFKVVIEYNSNGELEVKTNTDELVEVIIKDKVSEEDINQAHEHNDSTINSINTAYGALEKHLNIGIVESDFEDDLISAHKRLGKALGMGEVTSWKDEDESTIGFVKPIEAYRIREKFEEALKSNDYLEVLDVNINNTVGIDPEDEFHVLCSDGTGFGYCVEKNIFVEMRYPQIKDLTEEQRKDAQEYRGHNEEVNETDVMLLHGKALYIQKV